MNENVRNIWLTCGVRRHVVGPSMVNHGDPPNGLRDPILLQGPSFPHVPSLRAPIPHHVPILLHVPNCRRALWGIRRQNRRYNGGLGLSQLSIE